MPLLDEQLLRAVRRRMAEEMAKEAGLSLDQDQLRELSGTEPARGWGCFLGALVGASYKITVKLLRRILRTLLFWLLLRDVAAAASLTFHEGYLLRRGLPVLARIKEGMARPQRDPAGAVAASPTELALPNRAFADGITQLRSRIERVCREIDTRPFERLIKESIGGSTRLLRSAARRALRVLRRDRAKSESEREAAVEAEVPESLVDKLTRSISLDSDYLRDLDRRWDAAGSEAE